AAPPALAAAAAPVGSAGAGVAVFLASVALLVTAGTSAYLYDRFDTAHAAQKNEIERTARDAQGRIDRTDERIGMQLEEAQEKMSRSEQDLAVLQVRLDEAAKSIGDRVSDLRTEVARLAEEITGLEEVRVEVSSHGKQLNQMSGRDADLTSQMLRLADRLRELEERPVEAPVATAPVETEPSHPAWWSHVGDLKNTSSSTRWQAVTALGDTADPAVAEYLVPMLKDVDIFVRMATARVLGDLRAPIGIPALIDALEDPEASVREAAVVALRAVTGREQNFDPNAKESDRAKAVRRWREWWEKAQDEFLGKAGG
ncbi:MAG: HEAT repeat domain-containing protein, partial [Planctomycetota bacterium]